MKKTFILTQFGKPHEWTQEYFDNVEKLGQYGWEWLILTSNQYSKVPKNVHIIPMTIETFNRLIEEKLGVNPHNYLENGYPHKFVSDFYVASGVIFEDYLKDSDFWGMTNWDIVYGRLDHFILDSMLEKAEIFSDDTNTTINGIFSLFKNNEKINNLFRQIPDWEVKLTSHVLYGTDEYDLTEVVRKNQILVGQPANYPLHSHDRLEQHVPDVKLQIQKDGSLWELFKDVNPPNWIHARHFFGREVPLFHFIRTKRWPHFVS